VVPVVQHQKEHILVEAYQSLRVIVRMEALEAVVLVALVPQVQTLQVQKLHLGLVAVVV
tara:strand:- start:338 stop:514 length:177 start_codon:yes stop_codon:yes gene_type:complete